MVRVVTRMAEEGPTITVVPVDRKHHDVNELVRLRCVIRTVERRRHARPGVDAWLDPGRTNTITQKNRTLGKSPVSPTRLADAPRPPDPTPADPATSSRRRTRGHPQGNRAWSFPTREAESGQQGMLAHWSGI